MALSTALATGGCSDDSPGVAGTEGSSTGQPAASSDDGTPMTTSGADSSSGAGEADMDNGGTSTGAPVEVTLMGDVVNLVPPSVPIPDAAIGVYGDDTLTATANAGGVYEIGPFAPDAWATMVLAPSTDFQGSVIAVHIDGAPEQTEQLAQISRMTIDDQIAGLAAQMPAEVVPEMAVIVVRLITPLVINDGGPVTVTMDPPPVADTFYAPDAGFAPVLNSNELAFAGLPVVVYFNITPDEPGAYTFTYEHPNATCSSVYSELPTLGEHITLVDVVCE